jgi:hypothetical protein
MEPTLVEPMLMAGTEFVHKHIYVLVLISSETAVVDIFKITTVGTVDTTHVVVAEEQTVLVEMQQDIIHLHK